MSNVTSCSLQGETWLLQPLMSLLTQPVSQPRCASTLSSWETKREAQISTGRQDPPRKSGFRALGLSCTSLVSASPWGLGQVVLSYQFFGAFKKISKKYYIEHLLLSVAVVVVVGEEVGSNSLVYCC